MSALRPISSISVITLSDCFLCLGFLLLARRLGRPKLRLPLTYLVGAWMFVVASTLPVFASSQPVVNLGYLLRLVAAVVLIPVAFCLLQPSVSTTRLMAWLYVTGTLISGLLGFVFHTAQADRQEGLTTHPNFLALAGQLSLTLLIFLYASSTRQRYLVLAAAFPSVLVVVSTGSRAGLIALAATALVIPVAQRSARAAYVLVAAGVAGVLLWNHILAASGEGSAIQRLFVGDVTTAGSDEQRQTALAAGWTDFLSHPVLGGGFSGETLATHNIYLELAEGAGLAGLVGFLLILWAATRTILSKGPYATLGYTALGYALVGFLIPSLWERIVWLPLGIAFVAAARYVDAPDEPATSETHQVTAR